MGMEEQLANVEKLLKRVLRSSTPSIDLDPRLEEQFLLAAHHMRTGDLAPIRKFLSVPEHCDYVIERSRRHDGT